MLTKHAYLLLILLKAISCFLHLEDEEYFVCDSKDELFEIDIYCNNKDMNDCHNRLSAENFEDNEFSFLPASKNIVFAKDKKLFKTDCFKTNEIILKESEDGEKCNKQLSLVYLATSDNEQVYRQGHLNQVGIIRKDSQQISCDGLSRVFTTMNNIYKLVKTNRTVVLDYNNPVEFIKDEIKSNFQIELYQLIISSSGILISILTYFGVKNNKLFECLSTLKNNNSLELPIPYINSELIEIKKQNLEIKSEINLIFQTQKQFEELPKSLNEIAENLNGLLKNIEPQNSEKFKSLERKIENVCDILLLKEDVKKNENNRNFNKETKINMDLESDSENEKNEIYDSSNKWFQEKFSKTFQPKLKTDIIKLKKNKSYI
jgi:hypothetical protein